MHILPRGIDPLYIRVDIRSTVHDNPLISLERRGKVYIRHTLIGLK